MKKLPPFTLVHDPRARKERGRNSEKHLPELSSDLDTSLRSIAPRMRGALLDSAGVLARRVIGKEAESSLRAVVHELKRQPRVVTVGLWDLSSQVGDLPAIVERLNEVQPAFAFFEVQAAIPAGLVSRPERVLRWAQDLSAEPLPADALDQIENNIIFEDFSGRAERIRKDLGLDYLIGITPSMIAFEEEDGIYWNYFSCSEGKIILASTYDVYEYARKAGRTFEAAVAGIAIAQLLVAMSSDLHFHPEIRGCLFDFNERRDTIVKSLRSSHIEEACLARIPARYRAAADDLARALREYGSATGGQG